MVSQFFIVHVIIIVAVLYLKDKSKPNINTIGCCLMASSHLDTAHFLRGIALLRLAFTLFTHTSHSSIVHYLLS